MRTHPSPPFTIWSANEGCDQHLLCFNQGAWQLHKWHCNPTSLCRLSLTRSQSRRCGEGGNLARHRGLFEASGTRAMNGQHLELRMRPCCTFILILAQPSSRRGTQPRTVEFVSRDLESWRIDSFVEFLLTSGVCLSGRRMCQCCCQ